MTYCELCSYTFISNLTFGKIYSLDHKMDFPHWWSFCCCMQWSWKILLNLSCVCPYQTTDPLLYLSWETKIFQVTFPNLFETVFHARKISLQLFKLFKRSLQLCKLFKRIKQSRCISSQISHTIVLKVCHKSLLPPCLTSSL